MHHNMMHDTIINTIQEGVQQLPCVCFWLQSYSFMFNSCFIVTDLTKEGHLHIR
jgi:hypothetical protein